MNCLSYKYMNLYQNTTGSISGVLEKHLAKLTDFAREMRNFYLVILSV